jgi:acyl carrier protein
MVTNCELEIVRGFLHERLNVDPAKVVPEATLAELAVDSLTLMELFFEFEERLDITLAQGMPTPQTIGELLGIIKGLHRSPAGKD